MLLWWWATSNLEDKPIPSTWVISKNQFISEPIRRKSRFKNKSILEKEDWIELENESFYSGEIKNEWMWKVNYYK